MGTAAEIDVLAKTLFGRSRRAVLGLLLGHPDEEFYFRQIARVAGGGVGAVQRELKLLAAAGIIRRSVRGRQVYFRANPDCPVFEELSRILVKTAGVADVLQAALAPLNDRLRLAFIFGSVARAQQRSESDVDLLAVGDVAFAELVGALAQAQVQLHREINPTIYAPPEFAAKIRGGHHFLRSVLKREKIFLIGDDGELERLAEKRLVD